MGNYREIVNTIKNPATGETLDSEGRIVEVKLDNEELKITYKRDGITTDEKRIIEDLMVSELKSLISEDKIFIKTTSEKGPMVKQETKEAKADLKVGHGNPGANKKRVPNVGQVLAVCSGKGGVGKSTVSVNLAISLANQGKKVGLIDADIYGPSVPMLLGKRDAKPLANDSKKIVPIESNGIKFISFGLFISEGDPVIWRGPMLGGVLNQFLFDVDWGQLDYLILDLPPGTGDIQLSMIQATEVGGIIGVSTPQEVAVLDSKKGFKMFNQVNVPILGLIENMSYFAPDDDNTKKYFIFGNGKIKEVAKELETNFLGDIPLEIALRESCDNGQPYMSNPKYEGRAVWKSYNEIAKKLIDMTAPEKKGFFSKILGR